MCDPYLYITTSERELQVPDTKRFLLSIGPCLCPFSCALNQRQKAWCRPTISPVILLPRTALIYSSAEEGKEGRQWNTDMDHRSQRTQVMVPVGSRPIA